MEKTPKTERLHPFREMEEGMMAGLWWVPEEGFEWDDHLREVQDSTPPEIGPWLRTKRSDETAMVRRYPVLKRPQLLRHFSLLAEDPSMDRIRRFANRWGWLGRSLTVVPRSGSGVVQDAEPLSLWWEELLKFRDVYETWKAVQIIDHSDADTHSRVRAAWRLLKDRIAWREDKASVEYRTEIRFPEQAFRTPQGWMPDYSARGAIAVAGIGEGDKLLTRWTPGDVLEPARYHVHKKVNDKLKGNVNLVVLPFLKGRMRFFPNDLATAIYIHFAVELAGARSQERECESCHQPFAVRRRDQRFCDKNCRERAGYHRRKSVKVGAIGADTA